MLKQIKWSVPFLSLLLLLSCGKEEDPQPTKTQLLTQSSWKFQSATAAGTDITNDSRIACIKDDVITFSASGSGTITEGTIVCSPTTASNFTWLFLDNETTLSMSAGLFPGGSGTFMIQSITSTSLTISQNVTFPPSTTPIPVVAVYIH